MEAKSRGFDNALVLDMLGRPLPGEPVVERANQEHGVVSARPGIDPARRTSPKLSPQQLKAWLDEGRPLTLLDTRNDYEVKLGTFENALPAGVDHFRDFPAAVARLPTELKDETIVMFCTGGIRCEKAGPLLAREGYDVFQLEDGILGYFEACGGAHFDGTCFVFDERGGVDQRLAPAAPANVSP